eukprot:TRINITY_DN701_c0_g1_i1.p1 TRINITY_DN701_c0_g1~~TRINITY_DN701_c0_g1_i1.p1  ORF type:complete len:224 (+),score=31.84 TRINITY_DN701_c0_g1_i1:52-723(+)
MVINGILFCEFDASLGPKITYQVPKGWINNEVFDTVSEYVITKPFLYDRVVSISTPLGDKIMGVPVCIENSKYPRNALLFNLCFVFGSKTQTSIYIPILRKLAVTLRDLETESEFIYRETSKSRILDIITRILSHLNSTGECIIPVDAANTIHLKIFPHISSPPPILDHEVPVKTVSNFETFEEEFSMQMVLSHIDSIKYVKQIAEEAKVKIEIVRQCLQQLL